MKTLNSLIIFLLVTLVASISAQNTGEKPVAGKKPDPRQLLHPDSPIEARFPEGLSILRLENVELTKKGVPALSFPRFVADRPGELSAELALIPLGSKVDLRLNPRRRLRAMADLMSRGPAALDLHEAWAWHHGFPALSVRFRTAAKNPGQSGLFHRIELTHYPRAVAFLQVIAPDTETLQRGDVQEFFATHRHKTARAPQEYQFRSQGAKLSYLPGTVFDALDGVLRLRGPKGNWGLAVTELESRTKQPPLLELAGILAAATEKHGSITVIRGPSQEATGPQEKARFRLDFLEPREGSTPIHRVFIYLQSNKTRTLLSAYSPTLQVAAAGQRPYFKLDPVLMVPLSTFERLDANTQESDQTSD